MITTTTTGSPLQALERAASGLLPLPALSGEEYARGHALFEARSDQRRRITSLLCDLLAHRAAGSTCVLSVGCGDGAVDVELARVLARLGRPVTYHGIAPHPSSAECFLARLGELPNVHPEVDRCTFAEAPSARGSYDVVLAVHSLYYVDDLAEALRVARRAVAPGGQLVVVHAPAEELNALVEVLALDQGQLFSDAVAQALAEDGVEAERRRLPATLDLTGDDQEQDGDAVLDFAVQVRLPALLRGPVLDVLRDASLPGGGLRVQHPVDAFLVPPPRPPPGAVPAHGRRLTHPPRRGCRGRQAVRRRLRTSAAAPEAGARPKRTSATRDTMPLPVSLVRAPPVSAAAAGRAQGAPRGSTPEPGTTLAPAPLLRLIRSSG